MEKRLLSKLRISGPFFCANFYVKKLCLLVYVLVQFVVLKAMQNCLLKKQQEGDGADVRYVVNSYQKHQCCNNISCGNG